MPGTSIAHESHAIDSWRDQGLSPPEERSRCSQEVRDLISCSKISSVVAIHTEDDRIRLDAASSAHSAAWLNAVPSPLIGTLLNDAVFRSAIAFRPGLEFVGSVSNCICGTAIDNRGLYALACPKLSGAKIARHGDICHILARAIRQAGIPCRLEPQGLSSPTAPAPTARP